LKSSRPAALLLLAATPWVASAQLIRPDSATATSQFSSGYLVANAINGSGLPANFTINDSHATYAFGNHWTTATGQTINQSATFSFTTDKTLGGFHMWQHRSNGVASNPFYAVTRFDLVLRNAGGTVLANLTDLIALPGIANAQTFAFPITPQVRSVQFIVRATQNNNASPFTGLAEVAFSPCIAAGAVGQAPQSVCPLGTLTLTPGILGSAPFTYQWEHQDPTNPAVWLPISDGPLSINGAPFGTASGANLLSLQLSGSTAQPFSLPSANFRCVVTNTCGTANSGLTPVRVCVGDFTCDGGVDGDDVIEFFAVWDINDPAADINGDGGVDGDDVIEFFLKWDTGC